MFQEPAGLPVKEVAAVDLARMFSAAVDFAGETFDKPSQAPAGREIRVVAKDPAGHGIRCQAQGKTILMVDGTPQQMGTAQGTLLRDPIDKLCEHVLYMVGAGDSLHTGTWSFDRFAEIERRARPHLPQRDFDECDALARAAGISTRDGRAANLFPERFHCSGVAVCGKATIDGKVLHARVLDYMRDIRLQDAAVVQVFMPQGRNAWVSQGYAGFIGTVTAMNAKGLAIGEMGGARRGRLGRHAHELPAPRRHGTGLHRGRGPGNPPPHAPHVRILLRPQRQVAGDGRRALRCAANDRLAPGATASALAARAGRFGAHFRGQPGRGAEQPAAIALRQD